MAPTGGWTPARGCGWGRGSGASRTPPRRSRCHWHWRCSAWVAAYRRRSTRPCRRAPSGAASGGAATAAGSCGCSASPALTAAAAVASVAVSMAPDMARGGAAAGRSCTPRRPRSSRWCGECVGGGSDSAGHGERIFRHPCSCKKDSAVADTGRSGGL